MNTNKKFLSLFLSLLVSFLLLGTTFTNNVKADTQPPVQLYYGQYLQTAIWDGSCFDYSSNGYIAVQKSSSPKNITVHYSTDNGANWKDINATYVKDNPSDGCELWKFNLDNLSGPVSVQFAIKYECNGITYWDNNQGKNYFLSPTNTSVFGKSQLYTGVSYWYDGSHVGGDITLNNIGNPKIVKIRYSYDNWATFSETNASYVNTSQDNSVDYWSYNIPSNPSAKQVSFAICYTVNGIEYWDNNFGDNYNLKLK